MHLKLYNLLLYFLFSWSGMRYMCNSWSGMRYMCNSWSTCISYHSNCYTCISYHSNCYTCISYHSNCYTCISYHSNCYNSWSGMRYMCNGLSLQFPTFRVLLHTCWRSLTSRVKPKTIKLVCLLLHLTHNTKYRSYKNKNWLKI
jgi:hypothetical protein